MKKLASLAISGLTLAMSLTACGTQTNDLSQQLAQDTTVQAQSVKTITLSMDKKETTAVKKAEANLKEVKVKETAAKKDNGAQKSVKDVAVKFSAPSGKNDIASQNYAMVARYSLQSMNQATTYQSGYQIGIQALSSMASQGVYIARVTWSAANATKDWQNGYKAVAAALNHIASEKENSAYNTCQLVITMMNSANTYEDAYHEGFAALQVIGTTDNYAVKNITDLALRQAQSATSWADGFNTLKNALNSLSAI